MARKKCPQLIAAERHALLQGLQYEWKRQAARCEFRRRTGLIRWSSTDSNHESTRINTNRRARAAGGAFWVPWFCSEFFFDCSDWSVAAYFTRYPGVSPLTQ